METVLSIFLGVGLAAACGFRVFVPLLVMSVASYTGHLQLSGGFEWIGSPLALGVLALATVLEIGAYYVPWLDNLLDTVATPAAVIAGIVVTASAVGDVSPMMRWGLAVIAGGGAAGIVQAATAATRQVSSLTTMGLANPALSTAEAGGSLVVSLLSLVVPVATVFVLALLCVLVYGAGRRRRVPLETQALDSTSRDPT
jgi:hypothetical protein